MSIDLARTASSAAPGALPARQIVPSGQMVELFEVLIDAVGSESWVRFRFLAPAIGKTDSDLPFEQVEQDFEHLCTAVALPYIAEYGLAADVIAIALLDRAVDFGTPDPDATQYIETFRFDGASCIAEVLW